MFVDDLMADLLKLIPLPDGDRGLFYSRGYMCSTARQMNKGEYYVLALFARSA
jgi:hypothetical protein